MATTAKTGPIIDEDRLSKLLDDLLHLILSFLDAKIAVQTSVLSSRWRHLWTSLPFLNFERPIFCDNLERDSILNKVATFENFVRQFLSRRDASSHVSHLRISLPSDCDAYCDISPTCFPGDGSFVDAIIEYAYPMGIRHLSISAFGEAENLAHLSNFQFLATLELTGLKFWKLKFDSPTITTLRLDSCVFISSGNTVDPFKDCVNLRSLYMCRCHMMCSSKNKKFGITAPQLRDLTVDITAELMFRYPAVLVLSTPMLTSLHYEGSGALEFSTNVGLPSLRELYIDFVTLSYKGHRQIALRAIEVLEVMRNAKSVTLGPFISKIMQKIPDIFNGRARASLLTRLQSLKSTTSCFPLHPNLI